MTRTGSAKARCALANGTPCFAWFSWSLPRSQSNPVFAMRRRLARIQLDSHTFVWLPCGGLCDLHQGNPHGGEAENRNIPDPIAIECVTAAIRPVTPWIGPGRR